MFGWFLVGCALLWDLIVFVRHRKNLSAPDTMTKVAFRFQARHPSFALLAWVAGGIVFAHLLVEPLVRRKLAKLEK
jgi:hypothetical protein